MFKRARSAITGRFITLAQALKDKATSVIETVRKALRGGVGGEG